MLQDPQSQGYNQGAQHAFRQESGPSAPNLVLPKCSVPRASSASPLPERARSVLTWNSINESAFIQPWICRSRVGGDSPLPIGCAPSGVHVCLPTIVLGKDTTRRMYAISGRNLGIIRMCNRRVGPFLAPDAARFVPLFCSHPESNRAHKRLPGVCRSL